MNAIHHRLVAAFQLLGRGDIGQHHEFLDQPMAIESRPRRDTAHGAIVVQHHATFRQIEIERAARGACREQCAERGVEIAVEAGIAGDRGPAAHFRM